MESDVIGIDLGTTFSVVGMWRNGRVEIIANGEGKRKVSKIKITILGKYTTPSMVSYTDDEILVGEAAKQKLASNPENTVYGKNNVFSGLLAKFENLDMKRLIGKKWGDENVEKNRRYWTFKVTQDGNRPIVDVMKKRQHLRVYPENISTLVLKKMKETAERVSRKELQKAVITVPAYFNQLQVRYKNVDKSRFKSMTCSSPGLGPGTCPSLYHKVHSKTDTLPKISSIPNLSDHFSETSNSRSRPRSRT